MQPIKLFIGVCNSQEFVPSDFHWSWEELEKPHEYQKVRFADHDPIVRNNQMVRDFLRSDCDIMVKMDIDQVYPKNYFTVMVPLVEQYKVIGPLIYNKWRKNKYPPLLCQENDFPIARPATNWFKKAKNNILKIGYAHTNMFYARETVEKIKPPWYDISYTKDGCAMAVSADFVFLDKIKAQGYEMYVNTSVEVGHLVMESINTATHERWVGIMRR